MENLMRKGRLMKIKKKKKLVTWIDKKKEKAILAYHPFPSETATDSLMLSQCEQVESQQISILVIIIIPGCCGSY